MMNQRAGRTPQTGLAALAALAFVLVFLTCGAAIASDAERQIPMLRDTTGSAVTMEISREGTRQTATPFLTLSEPAVQRIEDRIAKLTARLEAMSTPSGETVADAAPRVGLGGTEITIRNVKNFLKGIRATRTEKPAPAANVAAPEQRLGMAAAPPGGAN